LGAFRSLSLPFRDLNKAMEFWRLLGMAVEPSEDPWEGFTLPGTPLAGHARRALPEPVLLFQHGEGFEIPDDAGLQPDFALDALGEHEHAVLRTEEDLAVIVLG
jgi:hypothetical protein